MFVLKTKLASGVNSNTVNALEDQLKALGIQETDRFYKYNIAKVVKYRLDLENRQIDPNKPVVVMFGPRSDENGAFSSSTNSIANEVLGHGNQLLYFEINKLEDVFSNIELLINNLPAGQKITLILSGHGGKGFLSFQAKGAHVLSISSMQRLKRIRDLNVDKLILQSCSTGKGENNLASLLASYVSKNGKVYAPFKPAAQTVLIFDTENGQEQEFYWLSEAKFYLKGIDITKVIKGRSSGLSNKEIFVVQEKLKENFPLIAGLKTASISLIDKFGWLFPWHHFELKKPSEIILPEIGSVKINAFDYQKNDEVRLYLAESKMVPIPNCMEVEAECLLIDKELKIQSAMFKKSIEIPWIMQLDLTVKIDGVTSNEYYTALHLEQAIKMLSPDNDIVEVVTMTIISDKMFKKVISNDVLHNKDGIWIIFELADGRMCGLPPNRNEPVWMTQGL
ncbi:MAG: hypothetical protein FWG51_05565 [Firmicutes bacterium]|nr:hypothetical protein [Bacillota bacterium]